MNPRAFLFVVAVVLAALVSACGPRSSSAQPNPAAIEAVNRGVALMGQYDYDGAAKAFEQARGVAPDLADVQVNLAMARFNRGRKEDQDIEQASNLLNAVLQREPGHLRALYFKGIVLQHQGDAQAAIPCFEAVVQHRPDDGVAWYLLGLCRQRLGQDSEKELTRAIQLRPYLVSAHYRLWQTLQAAGQSERAAPHLETFKQLREHPLAETIELPQYNQMGDLALVVPLGAATATPPTQTTYNAGAARELFVSPAAAVPASEETFARGHPLGGAAFADTNRDGRPEILVSGGPSTSLPAGLRLEGDPLSASPLAPSAILKELPAIAALAYAIGDYDNDESPDLFVVGRRGNALFRGSADGGFSRVSGEWDAATGDSTTRSALWLDADHDGDLDLLLCRTGAPIQLFNNNSNGKFSEIAGASHLGATTDVVLALPGDFDGDRDLDLVLTRAEGPPVLLLNELAGKFRRAGVLAGVRGELGGMLQDFNGDGHLDLLALGGEPAVVSLSLGDGRGHFSACPGFASVAQPLAAAAPLRGLRVADVDLDGDLDVAVFSDVGHLLLNNGRAAFTAQTRVWTASAGAEIAGAELADVTGDLVPDLVLLERGTTSRVILVPGSLTPAGTALAIAPTGVRSRDKRTRSPASGYGTMLIVRAGLREQSRLANGQNGGFNQSPLPLVFGLAGEPHADYVRLHWPDGVAQVERTLATGGTHVVAETQRKVSSCPVLFTWNGSRFEFITDFAGVGGLGYLAAPGEYANPTPVDHVKIEPDQLVARNGFYDVRITEPMEESAYVDRLELRVIDHPAGWRVFPDERLTVTGPAPTRELLVVRHPLFALRARDPAGNDCTDELRRADRRYAFEPKLDRRFIGFSEPQTLELDFGDQLTGLAPGSRLVLFINGYLEYPYSQTTYAASQAGLGWQPIRIERQRTDGEWETIVPDAGALGGMARTMTVDLTGLVGGSACRLRLTSNLEICYDQIFLAETTSSDRVTVRALPVADAELRYVGIAQEVSPDGRLPLIYDYAQSDPLVPFDTLSGAYTRYGPVRELLEQDDDTFVLMGTGDEIAARFDARQLPAVAPGMVRSFVLVSHAYCKDMDRYTGTPQTLEPMPFRGMKRYPYSPGERPSETPSQRHVRETYQTRIVE